MANDNDAGAAGSLAGEPGNLAGLTHGSDRSSEVSQSSGQEYDQTTTTDDGARPGAGEALGREGAEVAGDRADGDDGGGGDGEELRARTGEPDREEAFPPLRRRVAVLMDALNFAGAADHSLVVLRDVQPEELLAAYPECRGVRTFVTSSFGGTAIDSATIPAYGIRAERERELTDVERRRLASETEETESRRSFLEGP